MLVVTGMNEEDNTVLHIGLICKEMVTIIDDGNDGAVSTRLSELVLIERSCTVLMSIRL